MSGALPAVGLGMAIGVVMGLTGAGGGILAVPGLVYLLGMPITLASPVALVAVAAAGTLGAVEGFRRRLLRYRAAALMAAAGMAATPVGIKVAHVTPEHVLLGAFAVAMLVVAVRMASFGQGNGTGHARRPPVVEINPATGRVRWTAGAAAVLVAIGATAGFFTGLLGVGGGFLIVPALRRFTNIAMQGIVSTSLAVVAAVSTTGVLAAWLLSNAPPSAAALPFAGGALGGMVAGRSLIRKLDEATVQRFFAAVTGSVALGVLVALLR